MTTNAHHSLYLSKIGKNNYILIRHSVFLSALRHLHALVSPYVLDPLHYFELVPHRYAHLLQMFVVQFEHDLQIIHSVIYKGLHVFCQINRLQENLNVFLRGLLLLLVVL